MKRQDLVRHLEANGCVLVREGAKHSVYYNSAAQRTNTVPRRREVKNPQVGSASNLAFPIRFAESR
jgi:mRNA interferase HicA